MRRVIWVDTNVVMVSVGVYYFVGDSIKPFQSQNKHHNTNPPPSPTYPPHHPTPHAFIASSETETNDIASYRTASLRIKARKNQRTTHLPTPTVLGFSQCLNNRLIIITPKLYYVFFFTFVKCYYAHTVPGKSAGDKNRPWLSFLHFANKGLLL